VDSQVDVERIHLHVSGLDAARDACVCAVDEALPHTAGQRLRCPGIGQKDLDVPPTFSHRRRSGKVKGHDGARGTLRDGGPQVVEVDRQRRR